MAKISLKKDYMDGNVLYGKDLNPNFETIETTINGNDDAQAETNAEVEEALTQLNSDIAQAQTDIGELQEDVTHLESDITGGDSATLESAKSYTDTKLQDYAKTTDLPTKISQLENDDNTVKDSNYIHTDNNFSNTDKNKLDSLNNYELPAATSDILGGVKIGNGLNMDIYNALNLVIASTSHLGGVKAGEGVEIESDGTLNVTGGGGSTGDGIPTLTGTQEDPILLYDFGDNPKSVPMGLAYISGYAKETSDGGATDKFDGQLIYTSGKNQFIGPIYEPKNSQTLANLCFYFRPMIFAASSPQLTQPLVKFTYADVVSNSGQGYATPKAVYDYVGALASLNTTDKTSIVNAINELVNSAGESGFGYLGFYGLVNLGQTPVTGQTFTNDFVYFTRTPVVGDAFLALGQQVSGPSYLLNCEITEVTDTSATYKLVAFTNTQGEQGPKGNTGAQGPQGLPGPTGPGVPTGGTTGQVLSKTGDGDYETAWKDLESSGGTLEGYYVLKPTAENHIDLATLTEPGIYYCIGAKTVSTDYFENKLSGSLGYGNFITLIFESSQNASRDEYRLRVEIYARSYTDLKIAVGYNAPDGGLHKQGNLDSVIPSATFRNTSAKSLLPSLSSVGKLAAAIGLQSGNYEPVQLSALTTTDKSSLVAAINELNTRLAALENPTE